MENHASMLLVGKLLFSLIFVVTSLMELGKFGMLTQMAKSKGAPLPEVGMVLWIAVKLFYVYALFSGHQLRLATWLLIAGLAVVSFFMHNFWAIKDFMEKIPQFIFFLRNISIAGSLLIILALLSRGPLAGIF